VREAAAVDDGRDGFVAFVVPDQSFLDGISGRGSAGTTLLEPVINFIPLFAFA